MHLLTLFTVDWRGQGTTGVKQDILDMGLQGLMCVAQMTRSFCLLPTGYTIPLCMLTPFLSTCFRKAGLFAPTKHLENTPRVDPSGSLKDRWRAHPAMVVMMSRKGIQTSSVVLLVQLLGAP